MPSYPNCGPIGGDAAELQAFSSYLTLIAKLEREGHTRTCAQGQAGLDLPCPGDCLVRPPPAAEPKS